MILAIDTSQPILSAAVVCGGRQIAAVTLEGKESRNEKLLPAIDWMLCEGGVDRAAIQLLVSTRGPGSFTGVRIGLATMEGLSLALGVPLRAMSTHEAVASLSGGSDVLVTADAGRGELYASGFRAGLETLAPSLVAADRLPELVAGYGRRIEIADVLATANIALLAALRAESLAADGRLDGYDDPTPIYVRLAEAEVKLRGNANG